MNRPHLLLRSLRPLYTSRPLARSFSIEPRSLQFSAHASHRAMYRWTLQAFGVPFLVAYLCEKIAESSGGKRSDNVAMSSRVGFGMNNLPWPGDMGMGLKFRQKLTEVRQGVAAIGQMLEDMGPSRIRDAVANLGVY